VAYEIKETEMEQRALDEIQPQNTRENIFPKSSNQMRVLLFEYQMELLQNIA